MHTKEKTSSVVIRLIIAVIVAIYVLFPFFLLLINSGKVTADITSNPVSFAGASFSQLLENIKAVISPTIENYISRGFTSLMICFGCTGGQHRSVYSAENIAKYIHEKYGVKVILKHRELGIERTMEGKKA